MYVNNIIRMCLSQLTSCGVYQRGEEDEGIFGFLVEDIKQEARRSSRLVSASLELQIIIQHPLYSAVCDYCFACVLCVCLRRVLAVRRRGHVSAVMSGAVGRWFTSPAGGSKCLSPSLPDSSREC